MDRNSIEILCTFRRTTKVFNSSKSPNGKIKNIHSSQWFLSAVSPQRAFEIDLYLSKIKLLTHMELHHELNESSLFSEICF